MIKLTNNLRRIIGTYSEIDSKEFKTPLFIIGAMRSGTTHLVNKLASHPQLFKLGTELNEAWTAIGGASCIGKCEHKSQDDFEIRYAQNIISHFTKIIEDAKTAKRYFLRTYQKLNNNDVRISYDWEHIIPMNKSPHLINKISYVKSIFLQSKIIFIIRDIYAHSASLKIHFDNYNKSHNRFFIDPNDPKSCYSRFEGKNLFNSSEYKNYIYPPDFKIIPKMWIKLNHLAFHELTTISEDDYLIIKYENLINKQENSFREIFDFLELKDSHIESEKKISTSKSKIINTTSQGNPLEKWKIQLSEREKEEVSEIILEYQKEYDSIITTI